MNCSLLRSGMSNPLKPLRVPVSFKVTLEGRKNDKGHAERITLFFSTTAPTDPALSPEIPVTVIESGSHTAKNLSSIRATVLAPSNDTSLITNSKRTSLDSIVNNAPYPLSCQSIGTIAVDLSEPDEEVEVDEVEVEIKNEDLPLTQRKFLNPANGKMVGYGRAKQLKLIWKEQINIETVLFL